jgi:flagellar hook-associated protein 2
MGAVGINFGSATSGTGFNVSSTVASIVANLQQVEDPWNKQLTSLNADDTALTGIGTNLSTLSSSLSALTDFEGVMSEKEGSSSDTNILTLTSAAASAAAGSHTIVVSQLAQTASDFSDYITSSDNINGALTIQVGNGTATTIPAITGTSDTLATYAAAINAADIGVTASVISDTSGSSLSIVSKTSGSAGSLTITQGGTTTTTTAATTAAASVAPTATVAATNTFSFTSPACELSGTLSYAVGGGTAATVNLGSTPLSLTDAASALNHDGGFTAAGLVATVSGSQLILTGQEDATGAAIIDTSASTLTTTTPAATYGGLTDVTSPIATTVASTASIAASNTFDFPSTSSQVSGIFSYAIGGGTAQTITLAAGTTLDNNPTTGILTQLNGNTAFHAAGLTASISGSQLIITGQTGASGSADIDTTGSTLSTTLNVNAGLAAQNAQISVDGGPVNTYASNTISTAITGVTFQLLAKSTTPVQVEIVNDNSAVESAFSTFVSAYNTVLGDLTTQEGNDSSGNPEPLFGNPIVAQIQSALSLALTAGTASGKVSNLYQLGISVTNTGTLSLDTSTLDSTLNSNYSDVVGFLQNDNGFGQLLSTALTSLGNSNATGAISLALSANTNQEATLNDNITAQNALIATQQSNLTTELNTANETLQAIPQQLNEMNELYSAMTGYNENPS